jgi:hypothetical protein
VKKDFTRDEWEGRDVQERKVDVCIRNKISMAVRSGVAGVVVVLVGSATGEDVRIVLQLWISGVSHSVLALALEMKSAGSCRVGLRIYWRRCHRLSRRSAMYSRRRKEHKQNHWLVVRGFC